MSLHDRWFHAKRLFSEFVEDRWFDWTHHVHTSGEVSLLHAGIGPEVCCDSELYVPARPANIRSALRAVPIHNFASYTFVDLGSGKGRALFVAAELPFQRIVGVELSAKLHGEACRNALTFRYRRRRGGNIDALQQNAAAFDFPETPLVLYLFNPFGAATTQLVLDRLERSLARSPRHVVVVLLWPRCGDQVARVSGMRLVCSTRRHQIFEAHAPNS